jgi:hypothetical protein
LQATVDAGKGRNLLVSPINTWLQPGAAVSGACQPFERLAANGKLLNIFL